MIVRFYEGQRSIEISFKTSSLHILLYGKDGEKQVQYNFFANDPRSHAVSNMERLARDLRRDGCPSLAFRVEKALGIARARWYDPDSAFSELRDSTFELTFPHHLMTLAEKQQLKLWEDSQWFDLQKIINLTLPE